MGLTCATIHVLSGQPQQTASKAEADRLIHAACRRLGYEPVDDPATAERHLAVIAGPSWLSVLDQDSPGLVTEGMVDLARAVSADSERPVLITSVYDSDAFAFLLFERGKQVDGYSSSEDLVPVKFKKWGAKKRAQEWRRAFGTTLTAADFQQVLEPAGPFADDQLGRLCGLFGLTLEQATTIWKDLEVPADRLVYRYHLRSKSDAEGSPLTQILHPEHKANPVKSVPLLLGEKDAVFAEISGPADAFVEPWLEISGTAVEQGLVRLEDCVGLWYRQNVSPKDMVIRGNLHAEVTEEENAGRRVLQARFPGLTAAQFAVAAQTRTVFVITPTFSGEREGRGEMNLTFFPSIAAAQGLDLLFRYEINVLPCRWLPLHCQPSRNVRLLNNPRILSAVAIVEDRDDDAFKAIRSMTESWIGGLPAPTGAGVRIRYEGLLDEFGNNSKRKAQLSLADVGPSKKWQKFFQTPAVLQSLFIEVVNEKGQAFAGVNIQRPNTYTAARTTIHLSLWWARLGSDIDGDMRDRMVRLVDQVFMTLPGLQGWLAEWDWTPLFSTADDNNYTPYEDAYGLTRSFDEGPIDEAGGFMSRGWCKGTLRGLGSPLWLGRDLLAFISRHELEKVARVQEIGQFAVRVETAPDDLRRLEEVLERILPRAAKAAAQA